MTTKNAEALVNPTAAIMYAQAWGWLTRQGIITHRIDCHCASCEYHINRYYS